MIPILFEYDETDFTTHGIGDLVDCVECKTGCNDEGEFELSFVYPKDSELFSELTTGRQVLAKANSWQQNQIFRIYGYEKEINGLVTVNCEHITYDLNRIPVKKFKAAAGDNAQSALTKIKNNAMAIGNVNDRNRLEISKFTLYSDLSGTAQTQEGYYEVATPSSARAAILDGDDSIKGVFGGNLVLDNYNVKLLKSGSESGGTEEGGMDRGVVIEYGVDLMDLRQEENLSEMATGVLPYYRYVPQNQEEEICAYGAIQYASGTFRNHKVIPLDITEYFPNQAEHTAPSTSQIEQKAREWMAAEPGFGEPEINLTVSYAALGQDVRLHDAVTVRFPKLGVDAEYGSKVTSYKYDVLAERMVEIEVGKAKKSILFSLEDASRLKKGLLPPKRIQNKSLTSDKYADGSVQSAAIGTGSVGTSKIANGAVKEEKIGGEAVSTSKIQKLAVTAERLGNSSVVTVKIADSNVATIKLEKNARDAIATVWEINELIANRIKADGSIICNSLVLNGVQMQSRYITEYGGDRVRVAREV